MNPYSFISNIFKPAVDLVDEVHTSSEEKLTLKNQFHSLEKDITEIVSNYETKLLESKSAIITAEANGQSWIQRNWRPITMLTFLVLVVFDSFGWLPNPLSDQAWVLLQIGLGGYVAGRSTEKAVSSFVEKRRVRDDG